MNTILVAYATAAGSTAEIAEAVGEALRSEGATVDVRRAKEVTNVSDYSAVVLGTGVRAGNTYAEAATFLQTHQPALVTMPVAGFVVCLTMQEDTKEACTEATGYLDALFAKVPVQPVDKGLFGGRMDYKRLPFLLRLIIQRFMKIPEGDHRNWDAIRAWAAGVYPALSA